MKEHIIGMRVSEENRNRLQKQADRWQMDLSTFCRWRLIEDLVENLERPSF